MTCLFATNPTDALRQRVGERSSAVLVWPLPDSTVRRLVDKTASFESADISQVLAPSA